MFASPPLSDHPGPNFWIRIGAFNLAIALTAGALVGIGLRTLLLAWMDRESGSRRCGLRLINGLLFLALSAYYTYVAWPMVVWDRLARIAFMLTALAPSIVAGVRFAKGGLRDPPRLYARILAGVFGIVLLATAALTLLRAGFITLKGDRVAMLLAVTGETRVAMPKPVPGTESWVKPVTLHHVVLFLQEGPPAADLWIPGACVAFMGRAIIFSHQLNAIGFPNLYELQKVTNCVDKGGAAYSADLPHVGPLAVNSGWTPFRNLILAAWPRADQKDLPWWGIRILENQSSEYPMVVPDAPLKQDFLFDITLDGIPTSRFTSPLEKK